MIEGEPMERYFEIMRKTPAETGLLLGNLRLAEDRVLTYAPLLWGEPICLSSPGSSISERRTGVHIAVDMRAVFVFQLEDTFQHLVSQRRRWHNGAAAGFLWLLSNPSLILRSQRISLVLKITMFGYACLSLLSITLGLLGPALSTLPLILAAARFPSIGWHVVFWCFLAGHVLFLSRQSRGYDAMGFLLIGVCSTASLIASLIDQASVLTDGMYAAGIPFVSFPCLKELSVFGIPFVTSLLHSPESFKLMLRTFFSYMLMIPVFVWLFQAHSVASVWDLNWGNRPSDDLDNIPNRELRARIGYQFRKSSHFFLILFIVVNVIFACLAFYGSFDPVSIVAMAFFSHVAISSYCFSLLVALGFRLQSYFHWQFAA